MTLLSTTTLSGASTSVTGISTAYNTLQIVVYGVTSTTDNKDFKLQPNGSNNADTVGADRMTGSGQLFAFNNAAIFLSGQYGMKNTSSNNSWFVQINNYSSSTNYKPVSYFGGLNGLFTGSPTDYRLFANGYIKTNSQITSLTFISEVGNSFSSGTVLVYGVK
jgi:hypothetical protein